MDEELELLSLLWLYIKGLHLQEVRSQDKGHIQRFLKGNVRKGEKEDIYLAREDHILRLLQG